MKMPMVFVPHGGGPWPFVETGFGSQAEQGALADYLKSIGKLPAQAPKALLVISAHWEAPVATVMTNPRPPMLYDYSGFPEASYRLQWPAPGEGTVAARVRELLTGAGIQSAEDSQRGFDHGTFVPLKLAYPAAEVPTVQLSLVQGLDPAVHLAIGRALAPLRDEGVFLVGSGMTFHNMRAFMQRTADAGSATFDRWLQDTMTASAASRDARLVEWAKAPAARQAHPREEHLLPLMVIAGAAGEQLASVGYAGTYAGVTISAYHVA